ncbi:hypothetical protein EDD16DRAFT_1560270 [Pisolithus croceorrhizus]|nr:hypothetical protein EDD16DRAFT_1560270 [Pisolithus croceorrhizus]
MAPKKAKASKMSLNEFLGDNNFGSWADEMDSLPSAPAIRTEDERFSRSSDRPTRRDDGAQRSDRQFISPREDVPLPTRPPYTVFVGNLAFDITEGELESFFGPHEIKSVKIIKDRDDKPKGFGYVEFAELDALKDALTRTGANLSGRTVRVSVAEPPKERPAFAGGEDDAKFSGSWRREAPAPASGGARDSSRRRFDGSTGDRMPPPPSISDEANDWRSSRSLAKVAELDAPPSIRKGSGISIPDGQLSSADKEEHWSIGSKFRPSLSDEAPSGRFGSLRSRNESLLAKDGGPDDGGWRGGRARAQGGTSPSSSTPPTPQLSRKKLELLPRSSTGSTTPSPLSSPKMSTTPAVPKTNPFGAAKPVDVSSKERDIAVRLEKEREAIKDRIPQHSMSRTSSRQATERPAATRTPPQAVSSPTMSHSPVSASSNVRPSFSFANAAGAKVPTTNSEDKRGGEEGSVTITEQVVQPSA